MINKTIENSKGMDVLANILRHCISQTNRNIISGLAKDMPELAQELRSKVLTFEDLQFADQRGMRKLLQLVQTRELAVAIKGASQGVLKNVASNMSRRLLEDLKEDVKIIGPVRESDIDRAQDNIMVIVNKLIAKNELYINKGNDKLVY